MAEDLEQQKVPRAEASLSQEAGAMEVQVPLKDLEERFSLLSTLGAQFSATLTPLAIGVYLSVSIGVGGGPVFIWGFVLASFCNMCICLSLAELASAYPHSSGQIYWTAILTHSRVGRPLSYVVGWLTSAGYFCCCAATYLIAAQLMVALIQACNPLYVANPWLYFVIYVAVGIFAVAMNYPLIQWLPLTLKIPVVFSNTGAIFVLITLLVRANPNQTANAVFVDIVNETGWQSTVVVFFIGLLPGVSSITCFDCASHLTDELPNPARQVPQVMMGGALLSVVSGFVMALVYQFCIVNPENLLTPVGGQPVIQLMVDAYNSKALVVIASLIFIISNVLAGASLLTTFSRIWWSFARDRDAVASGWTSKTTAFYSLPRNSVLVCGSVSILIGVIELGSSTALNAILGSAIASLNLSYAVPIGCLLIRNRNTLPKGRYVNLGRRGWAINLIGAIWPVFVVVWLCFPEYVPVVPDTMNYASVVMAGVVLLSAINWFWKSKEEYLVGSGISS